jgi:hypothetical protein
MVVPYILCVSAPLDHEDECGPSLMSAFLALVFWLLTIPLLLKNLTEEEAWLLLFGQPTGLVVRAVPTGRLACLRVFRVPRPVRHM